MREEPRLVRLYQELKRRRVFRVALLYAPFAWIAIEVAVDVLPVFGLSDWAVRLVVVLILLGFPAAIALAWIYDITPTGIRRTDASDERPAPTGMGRAAAYVGVGILLAIVVLGSYVAVRSAPESREPGRGEAALVADLSVRDLPGVAVLPFRWLGGEESDEVLAEALPLELIRQLSTLGSVAVVDARAALGRMDSASSISDLGERLGVDVVVAGDVLSDPRSVGAHIRLLNAADGTVLWSGLVQRDRSLLVGLQSEMVEEVAGGLGLVLSPRQRERLGSLPTQDTAAYRLYLEAQRLVYHELTGRSLRAAIALLDEATRRDSTFALAYAARASARSFLIQAEDLSGSDGWPKVIRSANRALAIDSTIGRAYSLLASASLYWDWDWAAAGPMYRRAIALSPSDPEIRLVYAQYLEYVLHDWDGAVDQILEARRLAPTNPFVAANVVFRLVAARRWEEAERAWRNALALDSTFWVTHWIGGRMQALRGHYHQALERLERSLVLSRGGVAVLPDLVHALVETGQEDSARAVLTRYEGRAETRRISPALLARMYLYLGDEDRFFDLLERAWLERDLDLFWLVAGWEFEGRPLEDEDRMLAFAERTGVREWYRPYTGP